MHCVQTYKLYFPGLFISADFTFPFPRNIWPSNFRPSWFQASIMLENSNWPTSLMNFSCFQNLQAVRGANPALQRNLSVRFQLDSRKQSHYKWVLTIFVGTRGRGGGREEEGNPTLGSLTGNAGWQAPVADPCAHRPGRCPRCWRRHSEHKRLTFCPRGSCGRPQTLSEI